MPTARTIDDNGFLLVKACPLTSSGIFDYGAGQIGLDGDPNRIVKVYRPESAVNDPAAIESFKNIPLINDHEMLSGFSGDDANTAPEDYGVSGVLTSNVYFAKPWVCGDLKIFSREMQDDLASGKRDLSLGYSCTFELCAGVFDGVAYEAIQRDMRGNHIALVKEARVAGARVLDGLCFDHLSFDVRPSDKETKMPQTKKAAMDNAVAQLKALLPALEQYLSEEAAEPQHQESTGSVDADPVDSEVEVVAPEAAAANEGGDETDLATLISSVEAVLAKLKSATSSSTEGENVAATEDEVPAEETKNIQDTDVEVGKEAKGTPTQDSALRSFYADLNAKTRIYDGLSAVVGAFDHSAMDSNQVCAYGVKKLGIKCADGQERVALDAYLSGVAALKKHTNNSVKTHAADSAKATAELDAYLGGK